MEKKLITVIVPNKNKNLLKKINSSLVEGDELFSFAMSSKNLRNNLNNYILSAKNDNIVIWNHKDEKRINLEQYRNDKKLFPDININNNTIINTSVKINRSIFSPVTNKNVRSIKEYMKNLLKDVDLSIEKEEPPTKVNIGPPLQKEIEKRKRKGDKQPEKKLVKATAEKTIQKKKERTKIQNFKNGNPNVLFLCDVQGWAWWIKSNYIKKYLTPHYNIDIKHLFGPGRKPIQYNQYDLCFTYGYFFVSRLGNIDKKRKITGLTAHRPINVIKPKMQMAHATHANSILLYDELKSIHDNCFYVPNGVDEKMFHSKVPLLDNGEVSFGHVGKLSPRKGQEKYIEPAVKKTSVQYFSHYNKHKQKISHNRMVDIHQNYDIFICASIEDGTPGPGLEAAACGRPIISNKIGNMPELVKTYETGILLDKRDIDLYVDAIKWCKKNPEKVVEMGANIRKKIEEEWTWELMAKNYLYMLDSVLGIERHELAYKNPAKHHIG